MGNADFVITGFPKCGTTALVELLGEHPDISVNTLSGSLEAPFFFSDEGVEQLRATVASSETPINGHKFVSYIYDTTVLARIASQNPDALVIVCIRDPLRALVSWRNMHYWMAKAGRPANHFVNASPETRDFYLNASLADYYQTFARRRLAYARHIRNLMAAMNGPRLLIISQERFAREKQAVIELVAEELGVRAPQVHDHCQHVGFADQADAVALDAAVKADLSRYQADLKALRAELREIDRVKLLW